MSHAEYAEYAEKRIKLVRNRKEINEQFMLNSIFSSVQHNFLLCALCVSA